MSGTKRRPTPEPVARQLRQEAFFGCVRCGNPFVEYHHIVEWKDENHFNPEHMVAVCPTCHDMFARMTRDKQYHIKKHPINGQKSRVNGFLQSRIDSLDLMMGGNRFVNCENLIAYNMEPIMTLERGLYELQLSLKITSRDGENVLDIKRNEVTVHHRGMWDFNFKFDFFELKSRKYASLIRVDMRRAPARLKFETYIAGAKLVISDREIDIFRRGHKDHAMKMNGVRVEGTDRFCFVIVDESNNGQVAGHAKGVVGIRLPPPQQAQGSEP